MPKHRTPELQEELARRIQLVRRDIGPLLFHFTRAPSDGRSPEIKHEHGVSVMSASAGGVLSKILHEGSLRGTSDWTYGFNTVCFTEAPMQEFNYIFSLVALASTRQERPRYEPYGIAVSKTWLFQRGGRPVIYDHPDTFDQYPQEQQYRFVPYDPTNDLDYTWEREWRIQSDSVELDPKQALVVVPTAEEAFELVYEMADIEGELDEDGMWQGPWHVPKWLAVSLDLFGYEVLDDLR